MRLFTLLFSFSCVLPHHSALAKRTKYYAIQNYEPINDDDLAVIETRNLTLLASWCDEHKACRGFTTQGAIKQTLKPRSQWTIVPERNFMTLVKTAAKIPPDTVSDGYEEYWGCDFHNLDSVQMINATDEELKEYCSMRDDCVAVSTSGWLKDELPYQSEWKFDQTSDRKLFVKGTYSMKRVKETEGQHAIYEGDHFINEKNKYGSKS
jgi:hypothetical protein